MRDTDRDRVTEFANLYDAEHCGVVARAARATADAKARSKAGQAGSESIDNMHR